MRPPGTASALTAAITAAVVLLPLAGNATTSPGAGPGAQALPEQDEVVWLCRPGQDQSPCEGSMATTVQRGDGSEHRTEPKVPAHKRIDCFYVYPTTSDQPTPNAAKVPEPSVRAVAQHQAARFSLTCDVYAPLYRQRTVPALLTEDLSTREQRAQYFETAYADVRKAWREYLARHNRGRGFVLVGHSQGTRLLRKLVSEEVDRRPRVRRRLVSAVLLGGNVLVRKGASVGGDFRNVPLCRRATQTGCVLAWSAFDEAPPTDARFGRSPRSDFTGLPAGPRYEVACTNPASLGTNRRRRLHTLVRTEPIPGTVGAAMLQMYGGPPPFALTPWVVPPDRYTARCVRTRGAHVLMVRGIGSARDLRPSPSAGWGLHLADVNIALGDLVGLVRRQGRAFVRSR